MEKELIIIPKLEIPPLAEQKLRVCAYCRVSTQDDSSMDSLESQRMFFSKTIRQYPNWVLTEIYYDYGISGTSRKKRDNFNRMLAAADRGEVGLILTKEVSRFSRNLIDTLTIARKLRGAGVYIWFVDDYLDTRSERDMDALVDIARQAQRESERTSRRVQWGHRQRMEQGVVFGHGLLGYSVADGSISVVEEERQLVNDIFDRYLSGLGVQAIAKQLNEERVTPLLPNGEMRYKSGWSGMQISRILKNEKYAGDLLQQKTFTEDPLTHRKKYNKRDRDMVMIRGHHEAIIERKKWDAAQAEIARRARLPRYSNAYKYSGRLLCGCCGSGAVLSARTKKGANGTVYRYWKCMNRGCPLPSVNEKILDKISELFSENEVSRRWTVLPQSRIRLSENTLAEYSTRGKGNSFLINITKIP